MQLTAILEIVSVLFPLIIAGTKSIFSGNKRFVIAIVLYLVLRRMAKNAAIQSANSKLQSDGYYNVNTLAQLYRSAMNPTGYTWTMDLDGTNEELLFMLAEKTTNFNAVANTYRTLFSSELNEDLKGELSGDDYAKFLKILNRVI